MGSVTQPLCDSLGGAGAKHIALARAVGLDTSRYVVFYRHEIDCQPRYYGGEGCTGIFGGSLGNNIGHYFIARAAARLGGMDFVFLRHLVACPNEPYAWLPAVVATTAGPAKSAGDAYAHGFSGACHGRGNFVHLSGAWIPQARQAGLDIRRATRAWADHAAFPPADAPLDDVAIHLRCGDTLAQAHGSYGVLPVAAIAAFVPADAPVRVGILSEAYRPVCDGELAGVVETRSAHSASKCPCPCAALVEDLVSALQRARPLASVSVHDNELVMASWYRLAHAPHASLCMSSTFCLWPILGADHGYLVAGQLFPHGDELADKLPGLGVVKGPRLVPYKALGSDRRPKCGTTVAAMRKSFNAKLGGGRVAANASAPLVIRGAPAPPLAGGWRRL
jgi:hypothetical protein